MIKESEDGFTIICNECGYSEQMDVSGDRVAFKEIMRESDWHFKSKFRHICADCWEVKKQ